MKEGEKGHENECTENKSRFDVISNLLTYLWYLTFAVCKLSTRQKCLDIAIDIRNLPPESQVSSILFFSVCSQEGWLLWKEEGTR
jgi:hypothetical protein